MAGKTGQAIKHKDPRGRELSGTHDYGQRRQSSGKKALTSQQERPWVPRSRLSMLPEKLGPPGQERVRSKEQRKIPNRSSHQNLSRSHGHLVDRASSSSTHVQHGSRGQATSVLIPGEHKQQGTASILCTGASSTHGQHGSSSKQLSKSKYQEQGISRSQRQLQYSTSHRDTSESQVQPLLPSQQPIIILTTTRNKNSWKGYTQATGYPGHIRVDVNVNVNVVHHASPGLIEVLPSMQQQRGPFANIGAVIDEIYNFARGM